MSEAAAWFTITTAWAAAGMAWVRMRWWRQQCQRADARVEVLREVVDALLADDRAAAHALLKAESGRLASEKC